MDLNKKDIFNTIEEDYKKKCIKTDTENLYLFGNLFCGDEDVPPAEAVLDGTSDDNDILNDDY